MSQSGVYSELKPVWWFARDGGLPDAPKQVQLILSDLCNQDCKFCAYRMSGYTSNELFVGDSPLAPVGHNNPVRWIPTKRALDLLKEMKSAGVLSIQFTGGGEPTVHPEHEPIFREALNMGLRCSLVSNGVRWSEELHDLLPRFDWVRMSIDAASAESYAKVRRVKPSHFNRAWSNVSTLAAAIRRVESSCVLGVGFVVTPDSYTEIPEFALLAARFGAHNVRYTAMFSTEEERPFAAIHGRIRELIDEARQKTAGSGLVIHDNFGSRLSDLIQGRPTYPRCSYQYFTSYIGGDLQAYRCCVLAYNRRGAIPGGDLRKRRFDEFWRSPERMNDFERFDPRGCERCQFNEKNQAMVYVMGNTESDTSPRHMEWP